MPELLEDDLRAIAPQVDEAFVARLEARVEEGFAKPKKPKRRRALGDSLWKPAFGLAACVLLVVVVAASVLSSPGGDDSGESSSSGGSGAAAPSAVEERSPASGGDESGASGASSTSVPPTPAPAQADQVAPGSKPRKREQRTALELATGEDDFPETTAGVLRVADATGSIVQRSDVSEQDGSGYATYDLRVPTSRLPEALAQLSRLADVRSRTSSVQDITASYVSARDRLQDARDERRALLRALERAETPGQRSDIRRRLADTRRRIARAESALRRVEARSDRARVDVTVRSTGEQGAWTPGDALDDAGRILEVVAGVVLVVGAVVLPLVLVALALSYGLRLTRRRRRASVLG